MSDSTSNPFASPSSGATTQADGNEEIPTDGEELLHFVAGKLGYLRLWVLCVAILNFVLALLNSAATIYLLANFHQTGELVSNFVSFFVYAVSGFILLRFYDKIRKFLSQPDSDKLEALYEAESLYWMFLGKVCVGAILLFVLVIVAGIVIGTMGIGA